MQFPQGNLVEALSVLYFIPGMELTIATSQIEESISVKRNLISIAQEITQAGELCAAALGGGGKILLCGNGGSAADAQHIAAELVIRYKGGNERRALPAMTLSGDPSTITACGNDYGYDELFSRQVEAFGKPGDILIGISTSGNSKNVIKAVDKAENLGLTVILLLGGDGGALRSRGKLRIVVPSKVTARIQECHILVGHILCSVIEKELFNLE